MRGDTVTFFSSEPPYRYRIRGIYSTAISKILIDEGQLLSLPTPKIRERLDLPPQYGISPADATIKDLPSLQAVLTIGWKQPVELCVNLLKQHLETIFFHISPYSLHAIYKGIVRSVNADQGYAEIQITPTKVAKLFIKNPNEHSLQIGEPLLVGINRAPLTPEDPIELTMAPKLVGRYAYILFEKPIVILSPFIPKHTHDALIRFGKELIAELKEKIPIDWGIRWRSAAITTTEKELKREIEMLLDQAAQILKNYENAPDSEPIELHHGESIAVIGFSHLEKRQLDEIRNKVVPTVPGHHEFKSSGTYHQELVEFSELMLSRKEFMTHRDVLGKVLREYTLDKLKETKYFRIYHGKPTGKTYYLRSGVILELTSDHIIVKRTFDKKGVFNGLNVDREEGDYDIVYVPLTSDFMGDWWYKHDYYSSEGTLKGTYYNLNTPIELTFNGMRYIDLLLDVVKRPGENPKLVDLDEFEAYYEKGIIPHKYYLKVKTLAYELMRTLP